MKYNQLPKDLESNRICIMVRAACVLKKDKGQHLVTKMLVVYD